MFCDMEGFTSLCEKLGPEEMYTLMDQSTRSLSKKCMTMRALVNEMTGDGSWPYSAPHSLRRRSPKSHKIRHDYPPGDDEIQ